MNLQRLFYFCCLGFFLLVSCFVLLAPVKLLERLYVWVWSPVLLVPVAWWLWAFVRTLYRGGE